MNKLAAMRHGGLLHGRLRQRLYQAVQPGSTPQAVEQLATRTLKELGAEPSFTKVKNYHWATCININDSCVHGIPTSTSAFLPSDVVTVDVGLYYHGYHLDGAFTKQLAPPTAEGTKLINGGQAALEAALRATKPGARIGHLSEAIHSTLTSYGLAPFRELTGHGVGRSLHEDPMLPNFFEGNPQATPQLVLGQTLAVEIICTLGKPELELEKDGWTIRTKDGKLSGVFEETVEVTVDGCSVLTRPTLSQGV